MNIKSYMYQLLINNDWEWEEPISCGHFVCVCTCTCLHVHMFSFLFSFSSYLEEMKKGRIVCVYSLSNACGHDTWRNDLVLFIWLEEAFQICVSYALGTGGHEFTLVIQCYCSPVFLSQWIISDGNGNLSGVMSQIFKCHTISRGLFVFTCFITIKMENVTQC